MYAKRVSILIFACLISAPVEAQQKRDAFYYLNEINKASLVMLTEEKIVPRDLAARIAASLSTVIADGDKPGAMRSGDYLAIENDMMRLGGPEMSRIHSGRSRQDMAAASRRMFQRESILRLSEALARARSALLAFGDRDRYAIVPAYTWGVQAQPITLGHYVTGYGEALERDGERLRQAYGRINLSPMGAAALGTSSFPVNRRRLAELLGFDGVLENSYGANQIAPADAGIDMVSVAANIALTVGMLASDLTGQYHQSRPWFVMDEKATKGSSIMPQKRNPTNLVRLRADASAVVGKASGFLFLAHNVEPGMVDYKGSEPEATADAAAKLLDGLVAVLEALRIDSERALEEVEQDYSTTTELADVLQREANVPFRMGHHFASALTSYGRGAKLKPKDIPYAEAQRIYADSAKEMGLSDTALPLREARFREALSARGMVEASRGLGGPQRAEVDRMLARQSQVIAGDNRWTAGRRHALEVAFEWLNTAFNRLK